MTAVKTLDAHTASEHFFSTVIQLSTDPPHMLDLQKDDPEPPTHHHHPYLSWDLHLCDRMRRSSWDPTQQNSRPRHDCTMHTHLRKLYIYVWQLDRHICLVHVQSELKICTSVKKEQLSWVKLCLYWHTVKFQLSLMKQHGYKLYSHQGTIIFVHFALWFIV